MAAWAGLSWWGFRPSLIRLEFSPQQTIHEVIHRLSLQPFRLAQLALAPKPRRSATRWLARLVVTQRSSHNRWLSQPLTRQSRACSYRC